MLFEGLICFKYESALSRKMTKKSIMLDLNDPRAAAVASVISNKTCKNILTLLAEGDLSESEIATKLKIPINTTEYNLKKLIHAGLVEQSKSFWSAKGKNVPVYRVSGRRIIIEPSQITRGIVPAAIISLFLAAGIKFYFGASKAVSYGSQGSIAVMKEVVDSGAGSSGSAPSVSTGVFDSALYSSLANAPNSWVWFLIGALVAVLIVLLWNWRSS